jgi:hypothetical protein
MKKISIAFGMLVCSSLVFSQTLAFRCNFSNGQITNFDNGKPNTKRESKFAELVFDQIDFDKRTARLIGNVGVSQVQVFEGENLVHLIETTTSGNLNLTTIYTNEKSMSSGSFPVVHSRHLKTSTTSPLPSQYIGLCKKLL